VVIVGAGIVGVTAAYLLSGAGLSVILLEARRIGRQVTGRSTAKITTQHSLIYRHLIEAFGLETAQCYADANLLGMAQISQWVEGLGIVCDLESKDAYVYCSHPSRVPDLGAEAEASRKVGLDAELLEAAPLPFSTAGALRSQNQAQFNPAQYLIGLAKAANAAGATIFEETRVTAVEKGESWQLKAGQASVHAENVVLATNLPIAGPIPYDERTRPRSHIAMSFRVDPRAAINGMFIGVDEPTHSLRMGRDDKGPLLWYWAPNSVPVWKATWRHISAIWKPGHARMSKLPMLHGGGLTRTTIRPIAYRLSAHRLRRQVFTLPLDSMPGA
jgi:glycine/D-amino acid oxidase-like deaminating enzyme